MISTGLSGDVTKSIVAGDVGLEGVGGGHTMIDGEVGRIVLDHASPRRE